VQKPKFFHIPNGFKNIPNGFKNRPNGLKIDQNGRKIDQNGSKIHQHLPLQDPPKFTQKGIFGMEIYHLATLQLLGHHLRMKLLALFVLVLVLVGAEAGPFINLGFGGEEGGGFRRGGFGGEGFRGGGLGGEGFRGGGFGGEGFRGGFGGEGRESGFNLGRFIGGIFG
jgi:hypothetical protein